MLLAIGLMVTSTAVNYMLNYVPTWATKNLHLSGSAAFTATLLGGVILTLVTPLMGLWAERVGRAPLMWGSLILLMVTIWPAFRLLANHTTPVTLILLVCGWRC
jgi:MHS family proline/betaine transporter-like MFS transporter